MEHGDSSARVGDLTIHYELAGATPPWHETLSASFLLYHGDAREMPFCRPWVPLLRDTPFKRSARTEHAQTKVVAEAGIEAG